MNPNEQPEASAEPTPTQPQMPEAQTVAEPETAPAPEPEQTTEPSSAPVPEQTAPATPVAPAEQPSAQPVAADDPGKTMGIIGLILAFFIPLVGFIVSLIARSKSKKAGHSNTPAIIGIVVSVILFVIQTIVVVAFFAAIVSVVQKCDELGPGTHYVNGTTYECGN